MNKDQIYASLDAMLANPKAKTFLNHLVRAYMPATNVSKVLETPKGDFKCVLTRDGLISDQELFKAINSEAYQTAMKNSVAANLETKNAESLKKVIGEKKTSVTGKDTTTFMSTASYEVFADWVVAKSLKGDKHINWLLGSIRRESLMARAENIDDKDVQNKVAAYKKHNNIVKSATSSLGDFGDALSKLKAQLEANNN